MRVNISAFLVANQDTKMPNVPRKWGIMRDTIITNMAIQGRKDKTMRRCPEIVSIVVELDIGRGNVHKKGMDRGMVGQGMGEEGIMGEDIMEEDIMEMEVVMIQGIIIMEDMGMVKEEEEGIIIKG